MIPSNMTHEELERWHYANGDTTAAALYATAIDAAENADTEAARQSYEEGYDSGFEAGAEAGNSELDDQIAALKTRIEELEKTSA